MRKRHCVYWFIACTLFQVVDSVGWAESNSLLLSDARQADETTRVRVTLRVRGKLSVEPSADQDESVEAEMAAKGQLTYQERIAVIDEARDVTAVRDYESAAAKIQVKPQEDAVNLSDSSRLVVFQSGRPCRLFPPTCRFRDRNWRC